MSVNEKVLPIVSEVMSWIRENIGPSKKELKLQITDLEKQVQNLANGNVAVINNMGLIIQEVLSQVKADNNFTVNAETIIFIGENSGKVDLKNLNFSNSEYVDNKLLLQRKKFLVSDEDIALERIKTTKRGQ